MQAKRAGISVAQWIEILFFLSFLLFSIDFQNSFFPELNLSPCFTEYLSIAPWTSPLHSGSKYYSSSLFCISQSIPKIIFFLNSTSVCASPNTSLLLLEHPRCTVHRNIILPLFSAYLNRFPKFFFSWTQLHSVLIYNSLVISKKVIMYGSFFQLLRGLLRQLLLFCLFYLRC